MSTTGVLSFLGVRPYDEVEYVWPGRTAESVRASSPVWAVCKLARATRCVVLATATARERNEKLLRRAFAATPEVALEVVELSEGKDQAAFWRQFEEIRDAIRLVAAEELVVDVSNGFRSTPIIAESALALERAVSEEVCRSSIVYAAQDSPDGSAFTVWDLRPVLAIIDWSRAFSSFLRCGDGDEMAELLDRVCTVTQVEKQCGQYKPFSKAFRDFTRDFSLVDTGSLLLGRGKVKPSVRQLLEKTIRARGDLEREIPPLRDVLEKLIQWLEPLQTTTLGGEEGHRAVAALARRYFELKRYLAAATTVREGWINLHAEGLPGAIEAGRGDAFDSDQRKIADRRFKNRLKLDAQTISDRRNALCHGGYRRDPSTSLIDLTEDMVRSFETAGSVVVGSERDGVAVQTVFSNVSNHPNESWQSGQREAAQQCASAISDCGFPEVDPDADLETVEAAALTFVKKLPRDTTYAMVQGEYTMTATLVRILQGRRVTCVAATTDRITEKDDQGRKISTFVFRRFREYPNLTADADSRED